MSKPIASGLGGSTIVRMDDASVQAFVERHGGAVLRLARRFSNSAADAEDVYQRSLEMLLTKAPTDDPEQLLPWIKTVVRNEALMVHRKQRYVRPGFDEIAERWVSEEDEPPDRAVLNEQIGYGREVLRRIDPNQARCLLLRADGLRYDEICEITGFSKHKVARCLTEGRQAFRSGIERLSSGSECRRLEPMLSMIADDAASERVRRDAELHLASCVVCRATLSKFRAAPRELSVLFPLAAAVPDNGGAVSLLESVNAFLHGVYERVATQTPAMHPGAEVTVAKKFAVATLAAAAIAGGSTIGVVVVGGDNDSSVGERPVAELPVPDVPAGATPVVPDQTDALLTPDPTPREATERDVRRAARTAPDPIVEDATPPGAGGAADPKIGESPNLQQNIEPSAPPSVDGGGVGGLAP